MTATLLEREPLTLKPTPRRNNEPKPVLSDLMTVVREMQEEARKAGLDKMTMEEIDAEIATVRRERREKKLARSI